MTTSTPSAPAGELLDEPPPGEGFIVAAALGAAMAGVVHLLVVPGHWATSPLMSAFFVVVGTAQLALMVALRWRLPDAVIVGVIMGHLAIMGMYLASRTVDLPFVPPHDRAHEKEHLPVPGAVGDGIPIYPGSRVEPVGMLDVVCLVAEVVLVVSLVTLLPSRLRSVMTTVMAGAAVAAVLWRGFVLS